MAKKIKTKAKKATEDTATESKLLAIEIPVDAKIVSLRGRMLFEDKDYILIDGAYRHIANGKTWERVLAVNPAARKKNYITKEKFATLKIGKPLSL